MIFSCERRKWDGLLTWPQAAPEQSSDQGQAVRLAEAAGLFGGTAEVYEFIELTEEQHNAILAHLPARSFLNNGALVHATPADLSSDKSAVRADGLDGVTITADVHDPLFSDRVTWLVLVSDGSTVQGEENMIAGMAALDLQTTALGVHRIVLETEKHGLSDITVEGIE